METLILAGIIAAAGGTVIAFALVLGWGLASNALRQLGKRDERLIDLAFQIGKANEAHDARMVELTQAVANAKWGLAEMAHQPAEEEGSTEAPSVFAHNDEILFPPNEWAEEQNKQDPRRLDLYDHLPPGVWDGIGDEEMT